MTTTRSGLLADAAGRYSALESKRLLQESKQARPVTIRCRQIEGRYIQDCEAMMCARISLHQMSHRRLSQSFFKTDLLSLCEIRIFDSTGYVDVARYMFHKAMWAVWLVSGQVAAVK